MLLKEFEESIANMRYCTRKVYMNQIELFFKHHTDINELPEFLKERQNVVRKATINSYLRFLKDQGKNVDNIIGQIALIKMKQTERKEYQTLLEPQATKLIQVLLEKNEDKYTELAIMCMICFDTGARIRAVLKLRKQDFNQTEDGMKLNLHEKGGYYHFRRITPETYAHITTFFNLDTMSLATCLFFKKTKVQDIELDKKYYESWKLIKVVSRKLFDVGISFHWLRRGAGVYIYKHTNKNPSAVAEFYGHKSLATTQRYLKIEGEEADKVVKKAKRPW